MSAELSSGCCGLRRPAGRPLAPVAGGTRAPGDGRRLLFLQNDHLKSCALGVLQAVHSHLGRLAYEHRRTADRDEVVGSVWGGLRAAGMLPWDDAE